VVSVYGHSAIDATYSGHPSDTLAPPGSTNVDRHSFDDQIHEALSQLYDLPFLQRSPLQGVLRPEGPAVARGKALHQALLAAIEQVKPPTEVSPDATAWKTYRSLVLRYVRSLNASVAAAELGLSTRQAQRIHAIALESVAAVLWEDAQTAPPPKEKTEGLGGSPGALGGDDGESILDEEIEAILAGDHRDLEPFPVTLRGVLATLAPVLQQRNVLVGLDIADDLSDRVAPLDLTRQALVQLALGAIEYSGSSQIRISAFSQPAGAQIVVEDLADPDVTASAQQISRRLTVAHRLLAAMHGQLSVATEPALRIEATLPLGLSPLVLVVEDNAQVVQLFRRYLVGSMYRLIHAADADRAIDLIASERPSVVTLDVMMPRRDGWELLQALKVRADTQAIPVLICSVLRDHELATALGAAGFLPKPISQHELLEALARHVPVPGQPALRPPESPLSAT
jgi:CheY-like chemotaxis protein